MTQKIKFIILGLATFGLLNPAYAFEQNQDVLVEKEGKWFRGWVVRSEGNDQSLVAFNWNASRMEMLPNHLIKENKRAPIDPAKKKVDGWTSSEIGLWFLASSREADFMVAGSGSGTIQTFESESMYPLPTQFPHLKKLTDLALSPDGQTLAACQYSGEVTLFNTRTAQKKHVFKPVAHCNHVSFGTNNSLAIVGSPLQAPQDHAFWLFSLRSKTLSSPFSQRPATQRNLSVIDFSNDGLFLALGASNREKGVRVYAVQDLKATLRKELKTAGDVSALAFSGDGQFLAGGGSDQHVSLWKWQTGQRFWTAPWHKGSKDFLSALRFSPDDSSIAACGTGSGAPVNLYRKGNGNKERELGEYLSMNCSGLIYSQSGRSLYTIRQLYSNFGELVLKRYLL